MTEKGTQSCPRLYECSRIRMAPMIRSLLKCSAREAMESLCANCYEIDMSWDTGKTEELAGSRS